MVKVKVGYEAEIPVKTLFVYSKDVDVAELVKELKPNILWLEFSNEEDYWTIDYSKVPLPKQCIFVVCKTQSCVSGAKSRGFRPILDVEVRDEVVDVPYAVRLRHNGRVLHVFLGDTTIRVRRTLYKLDEVVA